MKRDDALIGTDVCEQEIITVGDSALDAKDSLLRRKSLPVIKTVSVDVEFIVAALRKTLAGIEYAAGLAAIQIGIPYRIAIVDIKRSKESELIMINPILLSATGRLTSRQEGCLSLPNHKGEVSRRNKIAIQYEDMNGQTIVRKSIGYEAAVIQHEIDHMNGILFWDRMAESSLLRKV